MCGCAGGWQHPTAVSTGIDISPAATDFNSPKITDTTTERRLVRTPDSGAGLSKLPDMAVEEIVKWGQAIEDLIQRAADSFLQY